MKAIRTGVLVVATSLACTGAAAATVERVVERISLSFTGFSFDSNFWAGFNPPTTGGPSPIEQFELGFIAIYLVQSEDGIIEIDAEEPTISIITVDIAGFSTAGTEVGLVQSLNLLPAGGGSEISAFGFSTGPASMSFDFDLVDVLGDPLVLTVGPASGLAQYDSPFPFDSPRYLSTTVEGTRTLLSRTTVIPLPAPVLGLAAALAGLVALRIARRGQAAA